MGMVLTELEGVHGSQTGEVALADGGEFVGEERGEGRMRKGRVWMREGREGGGVGRC